ncbi:MAG TPA: two-component regulator propeller domain-containing protein [Cyclobacteriaceae bacterium]
MMHTFRYFIFTIINILLKRNYCIIPFLLIAPILSFSQKQNLKFEHLGTQDGLSHSNTICMLQDSRGFMWFGTRDGLNKYDGYSFTVYKKNARNENCLSGNIVHEILEDKNGILWIATWGGGLSSFNRDTEEFTQYKHEHNNSNSLSSDLVNCIALDSEGFLWIGTDDNGLDRFDTKSKTFSHYLHDEKNPKSLGQNSLKDLFEDKEGNLWIGTNEKGLNLLDRKTETFTQFQHDENNPRSLSSDKVQIIFEDSQHQLWIGTRGGGLNLYDRKTRDFTSYKKNNGKSTSLPHDVVLTINENLEGDLWIGTENGGLSIFNKQTSTFYNYQHDESDPSSLSNNSVWSIYKDSEKNIWVSTFSGDINFWSHDANKFAHYRHSLLRNSLSHNKVLCIYEDSAYNLWIGTDGGGLNLLDRKTGLFTHYKHQNNSNSICGDYVLSITEDSQGNLWIGTWGDGITVFNKTKNTYKHFKNDPKNPASLSSNNAWAIYEDTDKNIWVGTYFGGVNVYNPGTNSFTHFMHDENNPASISNDKVSSIFEDHNGNIWVGTDGGGLNLFNKETQSFTTFRHVKGENSISNNSVGDIHEDSSGNLWIGTLSGLNQFNTNNHLFKNYSTTDGLPNDAIFGILEDKHNNLWVSTNKGLCKFNLETKRIKNFGIADGLQSNEFKQNARCKSRSGKMYFGGNNGFNEFFPDSIIERPYDPPIELTSFLLFNTVVPIARDSSIKSPLKKSITETNAITLSHDQSVISFEFASLNFVPHEKKQYSYFMEGFDNVWNNIGTKHTATYTNLDPGHYIFKVKGLDNTGKWSTKTRTLSLTITPPFWQTWWFRILSGLIIMSCIFYLYRLRINIIHNQKKELERQVIARTNEVVQQKENLQTQSEHLEKINKELVIQREEILRQREEAEKARTEAEQANKAKSVFLATMSHEIRTPMNGVMGMASLLTETSLTSEQKEYTDTIMNCSESLLTVINDILDYSKIESGNMELEHNDFDLRTCIEEVLDVFATKASEVGLDLVYELDYNVPSQIVGDSLRLRQVLINLVSNAIKFTHKGEIFVGVHLLNLNNDDIELGFEIKDTGIGIPHDKLDRLFKAFSQVDSSTTRKYGGTGLGLVISEKIVQMMNGTIAVESQVGHGTTFTFTIKANVSQESTRTYVHYNTSGLEGKKVLVVDDNSTNRNILQNQLEQWKLVPTLATSGEDALTILTTGNSFDLVLTDMQMPEMDGIELARHIRRKHIGVPIILLSSVGDDRPKGHAELFSSVLTKPVRHSTLCKHILQQLKRPDKPVIEEVEARKKLSNDFSQQYPLSILVAEDNPVNMRLAERVLSKLGYIPAKVMNGQEALDALEQNHYDLVLMDVQMPVMDGLETTRKIRASMNQQPVIIAMTANAMQGDREVCLHAGMDDYISKPIKLEEIVNTLQKWGLKNAVRS